MKTNIPGENALPKKPEKKFELFSNWSERCGFPWV
jgi:hypothetical protein